MKPKASKLSLGPGGMKGFLFNHVEKIVLGATLLLVVAFVYFGSAVETFPQNESPTTLRDVIKRATENIENAQTWNTVKQELVPPSITNPIAIRITERDVPLAELNPRIIPSRTKRRDPELYPPTQPEVEAVIAPVAMIGAEEEVSPLDELLLAKQQGPEGAYGGILESPSQKKAATNKKKKRRGPGSGYPGSGYEDEMESTAAELPKPPRVLDEEERQELMALSGGGASAGYSGGYGGGGPGATGGTGMTLPRTRSIIVAKFLIPFKKQWQEYEDALKGNPQYVNEQRDMPKYVFFKVERADVTDDPNADPATLKWELQGTNAALKLPFAKGAEWASIPQELIDPAAIAAPEQLASGHPTMLLTLPVPPVLLSDVKKLAGHSEINWAMTGYGPEGSGMDRTTEGPEDVAPEGPEGPENPENALTGAGGVGGYGPMGERGGGYTGGGGGSGYGPPGGYGGGYGAGGGYGGNTAVLPTYKLFRYVDFDVQPGRMYRYRVALTLEDPNHPRLPDAMATAGGPSGGYGAGGPGAEYGGGTGSSTIEPNPASLDKDVEARLRELAKSEKKNGDRRMWYRETDWSEPSPVVQLPEPVKYLGGAVVAARPTQVGTAYLTLNEPLAKTIVVDLDDRYAAEVFAEEEVQRGSVLNFTKDAEALHPLKLEFVDLKDHTFETDALVVDIKGGEKLPGGDVKNPIFAPGEIALIDHSGRLVVQSEASDLKLWHRYGKIEPKIEETKPEDEYPGALPGEGERRPRSSGTRRGP